MKPCPVQEELETIITLVTNVAKERQIKLELQPPSSPVVISADGEKLRQAFLNIVINALQVTKPNGSVNISTRTFPDGLCEISFRDTGPGIDEETRKRIFEPFFTTKPDGTGLGLAITKKIVESHGGALLVESIVGQGTTVTVRLPQQTGEQS
jgi:signal transduction histidine kinase